MASGVVVKGVFPLVVPRIPISRIGRATVHRATLMPSRFNWRQILRAP